MGAELIELHALTLAPVDETRTNSNRTITHEGTEYEPTVSERDAQYLARELTKALKQVRHLLARVKNLEVEMSGLENLSTDRARLEFAIDQINDLANGASSRDIHERVRAIREIARTA